MYILERYRNMGFHKLADRIEYLTTCDDKEDDKPTEQTVINLYNVLVSLVKLPEIGLTSANKSLIAGWKTNDKSIVVYFRDDEDAHIVVLNKAESLKSKIEVSEKVSSYDLGEWLMERELV